jgi:predicted nucleotidyltransferase
MDRENIIETLRSHAPELQAAGLEHLRLFGSVARGDGGPQSDVDLVAEFTPGLRVSLLTLSGLRLRLCDLLGAEVDLSSSKGLKDPVKTRVIQEAVRVF